VGASRWLWLLVVVGLGCAPDHPYDLVFITLDTVRRDHLPTYGYPRPTAPRVDALAQKGIVFDGAFTQQTNTNPSHASMFTGLYPHVHGSRFNGERLNAKWPTLAEILRQAGFRTGGFVSGITMRAATSGLDRGFEVYNDSFSGKRRNGRVATTQAVQWMRTLRRSERFFLFLHVYDAHGPYVPEGRYAKLFQSPDRGPVLKNIPRYQQQLDDAGRPLTHLNDYVDRYDAMIRYEDDLVASLLEEIDLSHTVVLILSDHGETLGERYRVLDHGGQVFDEQIRIPLILYVPGLAPRRVAAFTETVDFLPTLLEVLRVPAPDGLQVQGQSLVPLMQGETAGGDPLVFASGRAVTERHVDRRYRLRRKANIHTVRGPQWKLILYPGINKTYLELYDLESDPGEKRNVASHESGPRDAYQKLLDDWLETGAGESEETILSPEVLQHLRELGYVD
jgi:arylsulfatase A-like enzyme